MKRIKIFLLAMLIFIFSAVAVFADGNVFTISKVSGRPGDVVKVDVFLETSEEVNTIGLRDFEYDEDVLTFEGFSDYEEIEKKSALSSFDNELGAVVIGLRASEVFDGKVCSVNFTINEDAQEGDYSVYAASLLKFNADELSSDVYGGNITVRYQLLGDLNLDEVVDLNDAIFLLQYSMFPELCDLQYIGSVDFNCDGEIDMNDALLLLQYSMFPDLYPLNPDGGEEEEEYDDARVSIDGTLLQSEPCAKYVDGVVIAPVREFFDALGADVEWDSEIQTVFAERGGVEIEITLGRDTMYVKGEPVSLDTPATVIDGYVMVPMVEVAKAFGCTVGYSSITGTHIITTPKDKGYTISPANGKANVDLYEEIVFTFDEKVFNENGEELTARYVTDTFYLRVSSLTGSELSFEAEVSENGKMITIIPDAPFDYKTKYFVTIPDDVLTYADGSGNNKIVSSFVTREFNEFEHLIIPTTADGEKEPVEVTDEETGAVTWFVYAFVDGSTKYVPVKVNKRNPAIIDDDGNLAEEYNDKICTYYVDKYGLYTIISTGYDEDSAVSTDITVLNSKTDAEAMCYVEGLSGTVEKIAGSRYEIADFERVVYLTGSTKIIIRSYDEENEKYVYTEYTPSAFSANYDESTELKNISFVLYNYVESVARENLAVLYAEADEQPVTESEKNIRIVSDFVSADDEDGRWRFYYDLYNPYTGEKVLGVPSVEYEKKASLLDDSEAYKRGSIIKLDDGRVNHEEEFFEDVITGEELVYITEVDEAEGFFTVANYNKVTNNGTLECKECLDDSIAEFDGYVYDFTTGYKVKDGNGDDTLFIKYDENTVVSVVTRDYKFETINHWADGKMALSSVEAIADAEKSLLCYNEKALDRNGKFKTGYADFVKAYVSVVDENLEDDELPTADFVIVIVNADEATALDVDCVAHE